MLTRMTTAHEPKVFDGRCPYKGLDVFNEQDAEFFFGREKLIDDLIRRLKHSRTLFITGPPGSGKSSLVRAGVIPALKRGKLEELHSEHWLYATIQPERDPLESLATAFSDLESPEAAECLRAHINADDILHQCAEAALGEGDGQRFLLFVDQFEEVFTQVDDKKANAFISLLGNAANRESSRVVLLLCMRSDFVSDCAIYRNLNALLNKQFVQIGAMQPEELASAIARPALAVGLRVDPGLIAEIINDMRSEPGALPLMEFALKDLFDTQCGQGRPIALTRKAYTERGGLRMSLQRHADSTLVQLDQREQALARFIFKNLIHVERCQQDTRRTTFFDTLIPAHATSEEVSGVLQQLVDAGLILTGKQGGKDTVVISHEKLVDAWPWLKILVNGNRDGIGLKNEVTDAATRRQDRRCSRSNPQRTVGQGSTCEPFGSKAKPEIAIPTAALGSIADDRNTLTRREVEVLRLVADGLSDVQIAEQLVISRRTVSTHLTAIYGKLGVNSRSAATRFALDHHLV